MSGLRQVVLQCCRKVCNDYLKRAWRGLWQQPAANDNAVHLNSSDLNVGAPVRHYDESRNPAFTNTLGPRLSPG
jgi:hypothetical protein